MHANAKHPPSTMPKKKGDRDQSFSDEHSTQQPSIHTYLKRSPMNSSSSSSNGNSSTTTTIASQQHHNQINDANQTHANSSSKNHHQQQKVNHASDQNGTSNAATHHSSHHHHHHRSTSNKATTSSATTNNTNQPNGNHNTNSSSTSSTTTTTTTTTPSNRLCILCKNVAEGKGYAASSFVEQYKQLYPTYDGSPGIVCTQCYKKCYSYRKRLEKSEEKRKKLEQQLSLSTIASPTTSSSSNGSSSSNSSSKQSSSSSKKKPSSAVNDNSSSSSNNNTTMNPVLIKKRPSSNSTASTTASATTTTTTITNKNRPKHSPVNPKTTTTAATIRTPIRIVLGSKRVLESPVSSQDSIHSNATTDHEDYTSNELIAYVRNEHFGDDDEDDEEENEEVEREEGEDDDSEEEHVAVEAVPLVSESRSKKDHSHHLSNSVKATNAETFDNSVCACCSGNLAGSKYLFVTLERFYKQLFPDARGNNQSRVCNKCYRKCGRHRKASEALSLSSQEEASSTDSSVHSPPTKKQKIEDRTVSPAPQVNQVFNHESAMVSPPLSSPPEHVSNHVQAPQQVSITALPSNFAHMNNLMVPHHTTMGHYQQQTTVAFVPAPPMHPPNTTIFLEIQSPNAQPKTIRTKIYAKAPLNEVSAIVQKHVDSLLGDSFVVDHIERLSTDCSGTTIVETIYEDDYFEEFPAIERERFIIRTKRRV